MADNGVDITLKGAKLGDIDKQAAQVRQMYQIYRTMRKVTPKPGALTMDYDIKSQGAATQGRGVTADQLRAEAAKFRILEAIKAHVIGSVGDVQSFELDFHLHCREVPDVITIPEEGLGGIAGGGPIIAGGGPAIG